MIIGIDRELARVAVVLLHPDRAAAGTTVVLMDKAEVGSLIADLQTAQTLLDNPPTLPAVCAAIVTGSRPPGLGVQGDSPARKPGQPLAVPFDREGA